MLDHSPSRSGVFVGGLGKGPGSKRQRVAFWQLALAAAALVLLGLNVGAVLNSNFPGGEERRVEEARTPKFETSAIPKISEHQGGAGGGDGG
ncbi:unnamed protein product, partial [Sphacelaria rigidula]